MSKLSWVGGIARFRKNGSTAIMHVEKIDELCGYPVAYGYDITGEYYHTAVSNLIRTTKEDHYIWVSYWSDRNARGAYA